MYLWTSESVSNGHPDKLADQISDAILDAYLAEDPRAKVACEATVTRDFVLITGEVKSRQHADAEQVARATLADIGYTSEETGLDAYKCQIVNRLHEQSPQINKAVEQGDEQTARVYDSAMFLNDILADVPVHVIPCMQGRLPENANNATAASMYGSIFPAVWSFQIALRSRGLALRDAVLQAGPARMRPVLMTAVSTIFGLLPLALGQGDGSEWRSPMGWVGIGGLATSTLLTLLVVPVVYTLIDDAQSAVLRWLGVKGEGEVEPVAEGAEV